MAAAVGLHLCRAAWLILYIEVEPIACRCPILASCILGIGYVPTGTALYGVSLLRSSAAFPRPYTNTYVHSLYIRYQVYTLRSFTDFHAFPCVP